MTTNMFGLDDSLTARDERVAREAWHKAQNLYDGVVGMQALGARVGGACDAATDSLASRSRSAPGAKSQRRARTRLPISSH